MRYEEEYIAPAIADALRQSHLLPAETTRRLKVALSLIDTAGSATCAELRTELGENWVLARRSKDIVRRYGENVKCYTQKQFAAATKRAIEKRFQ